MVRAAELAMAPSVIRAPDALLLAAAHAAHEVVTLGAPVVRIDVGPRRRSQGTKVRCSDVLVFKETVKSKIKRLLDLYMSALGL